MGSSVPEELDNTIFSHTGSEKHKKGFRFSFMHRKDFPLLILAAGVIITIAIWDFSNKVRSDEIFKETQHQADQVRLLLNNEFQSKLDFLPNFAPLIADSIEALSADSDRYLRNHLKNNPSLLGLQLVNSDQNRVIWTSVPWSKDASYFNQLFASQIYPSEEWETLSQVSDKQNRIVISEPFALGGGEEIRVIYSTYPVRGSDGKPIAYLVQYMDFKLMLKDFFENQNLIYYNFLMSYRWKILFSNLKYWKGVSADRPFKVTRQIEIADKDWWLNFWPKEQYLAGQIQYEITGIFLLTMGILFSISTSLFAWSLVNRGEVLEKLVHQRTEQLEMKNEELEKFIYIVSHDLKAPLVSITGFTSILDKSKLIESEEERHCLERIHANTTRMHEMVQDLLELSRVGQVDEVITEVDTGKVVRDIRDEFKPLFDQNSVSVGMKGEFPVIHTSKTRLYQLFSNLINNAIKYMGDQSAPQIEIGVAKNKEDYEFYVKDNGVGISEEMKDKVFMVFQRGDEQKKTEGTGVGLSIVKKVVENLGGKVRLESEFGRGSTFYFSIPNNLNS